MFRSKIEGALFESWGRIWDVPSPTAIRTRRFGHATPQIKKLDFRSSPRLRPPKGRGVEKKAEDFASSSGSRTGSVKGDGVSARLRILRVPVQNRGCAF